MAIEANPTVRPEIEQKVFDRWWITKFNIRAYDPNNPSSVNMELEKYRKLENNTYELSGEVVSFKIRNLVEAMESDPELATIMDTLFAKIKALGDAQGLL